jgi:hypothetical protein
LVVTFIVFFKRADRLACGISSRTRRLRALARVEAGERQVGDETLDLAGRNARRSTQLYGAEFASTEHVVDARSSNGQSLGNVGNFKEMGLHGFEPPKLEPHVCGVLHLYFYSARKSQYRFWP